MGWKLAHTTGRWLLKATTGLWSLCTCCTVTSCPQVWLVYPCNQPFDPENCTLDDVRYWICTDRVVTEEGGGDPLDLSTLNGTGGTLASLALGGCWYVDTEHGPIDYEDIPGGVVQFPPDAVGVPGTACSDEACEPDYSGACACLCQSEHTDGTYCCWGQHNGEGLNAHMGDWTWERRVVRTLTTVQTAWGGTFPACADCDGGGTSCTDYAFTTATYGTATFDYHCAGCFATQTITTIDRQGCCANANVADPTPLPGGLGCVDETWNYGADGPALADDTYEVFATLEGCEQSKRIEHELVSYTPCGGWLIRTTTTEKIFATVYDGETPHCGCEQTSVEVDEEEFAWDLPDLEQTVIRLCAMCEESLEE